jgi:hypothetical protein
MADASRPGCVSEARGAHGNGWSCSGSRGGLSIGNMGRGDLNGSLEEGVHGRAVASSGRFLNELLSDARQMDLAIPPELRSTAGQEWSDRIAAAAQERGLNLRRNKSGRALWISRRFVRVPLYQLHNSCRRQHGMSGSCTIVSSPLASMQAILRSRLIYPAKTTGRESLRSLNSDRVLAHHPLPCA